MVKGGWGDVCAPIVSGSRRPPVPSVPSVPASRLGKAARALAEFGTSDAQVRAATGIGLNCEPPESVEPVRVLVVYKWSPVAAGIEVSMHITAIAARDIRCGI